MKLTLEQLHERDGRYDAALRYIIEEFLQVTGFDRRALACAGRLYQPSIVAALKPDAFITESVYVRLVNGLVYLADKGVPR